MNLVKKENNLKTFNQFFRSPKVQDYLGDVLGNRKESFVTNVVALVSNNVNLQSCEPSTVMYSAIKATSLGLSLDNNLGMAYVLPYNNKKKGLQEAQFQLGYKGFIQLAIRSKQFVNINATDVRETELLGVDRLTGEISFNWLSDEERKGKKIIGYVAYFELTNGFKKSFFMSVEELNKHGKKYSKSYNTQFSNWKNMFDAMARKTVIKLLLSKYAPLSIQMIDAVKSDQAVIRENEIDYVDNDNTIDIDEINEEEETQRILSFIEKAETKEEIKEIRNSLSETLLEKFASELEDAENNIILNEKK